MQGIGLVSSGTRTALALKYAQSSFPATPARTEASGCCCLQTLFTSPRLALPPACLPLIFGLGDGITRLREKPWPALNTGITTR